MKRHTVPAWIKDMLPKKCYNCGSTKNLVYHHIVPYCVGGNDVPNNIAVLCSTCHSLIHYGRDDVIVHGEMVKEGIKRAKARGVHVGKPCADYEKVMYLISKYSTQFNDINDSSFDMKTEREIMDMAGIKPVCYSKCKRMLKDAMKADKWPYEWKKPTICKSMPLYEQCVIKLRNKTK